MKAIITPSKVSGSVTAPPSKSFTHRAVLIAALADGKSVIENPLICDDTMRTISICRALGAKIASHDNVLEITGCGGRPTPSQREINVGGSGSTIRMASPIAALTKKGFMRFLGDERLSQRPVQDLVDALTMAGIKARAIGKGHPLGEDKVDSRPLEEIEGGYPPLEVEGGELKGGDIKVFGGRSSQFISSLLMISPYARHKTHIIVEGGLVSAPYVDVTIQVMKEFGVCVEREGYEKFTVPCRQGYKPIKYSIEGDWSSASYFFAAAAVCGGEISVTGLNPLSKQGDMRFPTLLNLLGHHVNWRGNNVEVKGRDSTGISLSMHACPDIVQTLAVVAAFANGDTHISGIGHLKAKEADRIIDTRNELWKMGISAEATESSLLIHGLGGGKPKGAEIDSHKDHRMAMAFTAAAIEAEGETVINGAECVSKSYPDFFSNMKKLGADIKIIEEEEKSAPAGI